MMREKICKGQFEHNFKTISISDQQETLKEKVKEFFFSFWIIYKPKDKMDSKLGLICVPNFHFVNFN
jgi:hypothetical protein